MVRLSKLYTITDRQLSGCTHEENVSRLLAGGARWIQLRDKEAGAKQLLDAARTSIKLTRAVGATLIINDRVDVALAADADGVHLGQDDLAVEEAREILGPAKIIGLSTHSLEQARRALETSADYITVGPIFPTTTKENASPEVGLELIGEVRALSRRPLVAIGGITLERAPGVIAAGADSVAVISALYPLADLRDLASKPDSAARVRDFLQALGVGY